MKIILIGLILLLSGCATTKQTVDPCASAANIGINQAAWTMTEDTDPQGDKWWNFVRK